MKSSLKYILTGLAIVLIILALWYFKAIVAYILISAVFSLIGRPAMDFLNKLKISNFRFPKALNAAFVMIILWLLFIGFFRIFIPLIANQAQELSNINFNNVHSNLEGIIGALEKFFLRINPNGNEGLSLEQHFQQKLISLFSFSSITTAIGETVGILGNIFIAFFSVSFITFFFLKDETLFTGGILLFTPTRYEERLMKFLNGTKKLLSRYFIGILLQITGITILVTLGMSILGLKFQLAAVIGLTAGVMNVIPYIGPLIGISIGLMLGIANHLGMDFYHELLPLLGYMTLVFIIVQVIDNILFQPIIYGTSVKAHPLEIFLVILIAGSLAGIPGMILAIPSYTVIRVFAGEFFYQFKLVKKLTEKID